MGKTATARVTRRPPPGRAVARRAIPAANREAILWLEEWMKTPRMETDAFWREFQRDLRQNRVTFRKTK